MPNLIKTINKTMIKKRVPEETIEKFHFHKADVKPEEILVLIDRMDNLD